MMRKYLTNFCLAGGLFLVIFVALLGARIYVSCNYDWRLPQQKHILFMGASHVARGIDDSLTVSAVNVGRASERYLYTYIKLQHYLKANPQIDTIFLQCSSTDLWQDTDYKYHTLNEQSFYISNYWPFFTKEEWNVFKGDTKQILGLVSGSFVDRKFFSSTYLSTLGGYVNRVVRGGGQ